MSRSLRQGGTARHVLCGLVVCACAAGESSDHWAGMVDTLPSGLVQVTNPPEGVWGEGAGWRLEQDLVLGEVEGAEPFVFAAISGLQVGRDGRIYVLDRQANELRIFSPAGEHLRSAGRTGRGPGEYQNANGLLWLDDDTLVVVDQRGERYSVLTREGEYVRSVPRRLGFYGWVLRGWLYNGMVYENYVVDPRTDRRPALLGTAVAAAVPDSTVTSDLEAPVAAAAGDTALLPEVAGPTFEPLQVRTDRASMSIGLPWTPGPEYHLDLAGALWFGHGHEFRIYRTSAGDTVAEIVVEATPAPVADAEVDEWMASERIRRFQELGGQIDRGALPTVKPYFTELYLDPNRYLWVAVPGAARETIFALIDPEGRYLGRLQVDGLRRTAYLPPVVRDGRLYLVAQDELDVQRVYRFRIVR